MPNSLRYIDPLGLSDSSVVRGMTDNVGTPKVGPSARTLGTRPNADIQVDINGMVHPNQGGISVAPSPEFLPNHRKPPSFGGTGKDPVWEIDISDLGDDLKYIPDSPSHGTIQPSRTMPFTEYQDALAKTEGK